MTLRFAHLLALLASAPLWALAQLSVGEEAPQNPGKTRAGDAVLPGEHAGKVQAITFWADRRARRLQRQLLLLRP